ncbi:MAG: hypothetical protein PHQ62_02265 [Clostridia bacterium]|nr:hypothetical protein [Clostridia bacterium]
MGESDSGSMFLDTEEPKLIKVNFNEAFVLPVERVDNLTKKGHDLEWKIGFHTLDLEIGCRGIIDAICSVCQGIKAINKHQNSYKIVPNKDYVFLKLLSKMLINRVNRLENIKDYKNLQEAAVEFNGIVLETTEGYKPVSLKPKQAERNIETKKPSDYTIDEIKM